jgi:hypothetical protein
MASAVVEYIFATVAGKVGTENVGEPSVRWLKEAARLVNDLIASGCGHAIEDAALADVSAEDIEDLKFTYHAGAWGYEGLMKKLEETGETDSENARKLQYCLTQ